jgi:hypothetical protein
MSRFSFFKAFLGLPILLNLGCYNTDFSRGPESPALGKQSEESPSKEHDEDSTPNPDTPNGDIENECPRDQNILIVDLKSGWWAGDGGDLFVALLNNLKLPCDKKVSIEYHHFLEGGINYTQLHPGGDNISAPSYDFMGAKFYQSDLANYTQIWFLSGSFADRSDLRFDNALFTALVKRIASSDANVFLGAGLGYLSHSNVLAKELLGAEIFSGASASTAVPNDPQSKLKILDKYISHPLFAGVTSIADLGGSGGSGLVTTTGLEVIAHSSGGTPAVGITKKAARTIVVDSGLDRYYAISNEYRPLTSGQGAVDQGTLRFLQNLIQFLSH